MFKFYENIRWQYVNIRSGFDRDGVEGEGTWLIEAHHDRQMLN